jgi:CheY-like chemotaxis protein
MGHLTSGVAHDFNNILGGILGYTELALAMLKRDKPKLESVQRYLAETQSAGIRAKELVAQMLVFSRMRSEQDEGETPVIWLQPVFKEVIGLLQSTIPATIKLNYHTPEHDLQAAIQPVHLHQILLNLGVNARDAMGEYGNLDFSMSAVTLENALCAACNNPFSGNFVEISVRDSGSGIPPEILQNIFDPFFTTKEVGKGTGMGLSVVHGVVHTLGGHILVDSHLGKGASHIGRGTAIRILLPQVEREVTAEQQNALGVNLDAPVLSGIRIMVVDDEHTMASMLTELLSMHGATVATFTESPQALLTFQKDPHAVDIVITDETMPSLAGMDMANLMLQERPGLPIVLCTGFSEHATAELAAHEGIAAFMRKPLNIPELIEHIRKLAPGQATQGAA